MKKKIEPKKTPWNFVALMAIIMSFAALAIDAMMPALSSIGRELNVKNPNDVQFVISSVFVGMGVGLIFFGPFSDAYGRKPAIYVGTGIFLLGCLTSVLAQSFAVMIGGRLLQGLGAASGRVATLAMIRDRFKGNAMAKIMSLIMVIFIMVPAIAPSIGLGVLHFAGWRAIFLMMFVLGILGVVWLAIGQSETLVKEKRLPFSVRTIVSGTITTLKNKTARAYTVASGLIFGSLVGFLISAQQILQVQYELGNKFPLVFGILSLFIGLASFANAKWVDKYGMENLCKKALLVTVFLAAVFLPICYLQGGHPLLAMLMVYLAITFFCFGILFGNFNALALEPLGHIAGIANSVIGSLQILISVVVGGYIGYSYNGTITPLVVGFFILGLASLVIVFSFAKETKEVQNSTDGEVDVFVAVKE